MTYKRNCPKCNKLQVYKFYNSLYKATKGNKLCKSCCRIGEKFSSEHKKKLSERKIGTKQTMNARLKNSNTQRQRYLDPAVRKMTSETTRIALHRPDIRKKHIESMIKVNLLGNSTDIGCNELLNKWNRLGFIFEPNYQVHTDDFLCYLDGYDKEKNIVMEYDSKYHQKPSQKERDLVRQEKIINVLHPKKFWRYNAVNKQWTNVVGGIQ
jgi:hypothetical protein